MENDNHSFQEKKLKVSIRTIERLLDRAERAQMKRILRKKCKHLKRLNDEMRSLRQYLTQTCSDVGGEVDLGPFDTRIRHIMVRYKTLSERLEAEMKVSRAKIKKTKVHHRAVVNGYFKPHLSQHGLRFDMKR